ncbi:MAG: alpha/beta fold hydrolase [Myxococcales bacterium]|nr:alpha/beta fold hydrolase [Myxococcales bacterium]
MAMTPSQADVVMTDGTARLLHFRKLSEIAGAQKPTVPVLLIPSLINRWYVLDLRSGSSLVEAFVDGGIDTFCLDWGVPEDEDRYLQWADIINRLGRAVRRTCRETGSDRVILLGYCMGGTLAGIYSALNPERIAGLINLAGPFDFSCAGMLRDMVDSRWFDPRDITAPGNIAPLQMQSGFVAMRPTSQIAKFVGLLDRIDDEMARESFAALETWANDNVPFPAAAYVTYIRDLYQANDLVQGKHWVSGRRADLSNIRCPVLTITATKDAICPPDAALGLNRSCGSPDKQHLSVEGGHVGAVVGSKARRHLYPAAIEWVRRVGALPAAPHKHSSLAHG